MANIGVLGAGSWGTALSVLLHDNGNQVTIWSIDPAEVEMLSKKESIRQSCREFRSLRKFRLPERYKRQSWKKTFSSWQFRLRLQEQLRKR